MVADTHDMRGDLSGGMFPLRNHRRSHEFARMHGAAGRPAGFMQRFGATVMETFDEWRRWAWPVQNRLPTLRVKPVPDECDEVRMPRFEVRRSGDQIIVRAKVPGLRREKLRLEFFEGMLMLSGELQTAPDAEHAQVESFFRSFTLPVDVTGESVRTEFSEGDVVEISVRIPGDGIDRELS